MIRRGLAIALLGILSACATTGTQAARSPSLSPTAGRLLVLLLRPDAPAANSRLEIVDLAGRAVASHEFIALPLPPYPQGCGPIIPPMVRVAAGAAYYLDSTGAVNRLDRSGAGSQVAAFTLADPRPLVSFAVSPDGKQLIGIVITTSSLDLETAAAGGQASITFHRDFRSSPQAQGPTEITGWDNAGPTATLNSRLCVQQAPPSLDYTGTALVHLAMDGTHLDQIGGPDCIPWDELSDGTVLCGSPGWDSFTVRSRDGSVLWGRQQGLYGEPRLSPDGNAIEFNGPPATVITATSERPASSARQSSPNYEFLGWAGSGQVVAVREDGHLGLVSASGPVIFNDLHMPVGTACVGCGSQRVFLAGTIGIS